MTIESFVVSDLNLKNLDILWEIREDGVTFSISPQTPLLIIISNPIALTGFDL